MFSQLLVLEKVRTQWKIENVFPFNELIISWSVKRPEKGRYIFYVQIKTRKWSPWICYAIWGKDVQQTFSQKCSKANINGYQDVIEITKGTLARGFKLKIIAIEGADIRAISSLYVSISNLNAFKQKKPPMLEDVYISGISGRSQMNLNHHRKHHLCSPTSLSTLINYYLKKDLIHPVDFALQVRDQTFDIYGNWVLNIAEANSILNERGKLCVCRLQNFETLYRLLKDIGPVIVSIKGPIKGGAFPYEQGHLIMVVGYDKEEQKVYCIDPAFTDDEKTYVKYELDAFLSAWGKRKNLTYKFNAL